MINLVIAGAYEISVCNLGTVQPIDRETEKGVLDDLQMGEYVINMSAMTIDSIQDLNPVYSFIIANTEGVEYEFEEVEEEVDSLVVKVSNIEWDIEDEGYDGEEKLDLPTEMVIAVPSNEIDLNDGMDVGDYVSDQITNRTGFCHKGFTTNMDDFLEFS
jgi:hypothetical protein